MSMEGTQGSFLVQTDEAGITRYVRRNDCGQAPVGPFRHAESLTAGKEGGNSETVYDETAAKATPKIAGQGNMKTTTLRAFEEAEPVLILEPLG